MGFEAIAGIIGVIGTAVGCAGYVVVKGRSEEKRDDKQELQEIRDSLRKLSRLDEVAELELERSYSKKIKAKKEIADEKNYLRSIYSEILESRRKQSLDILEGTRSELCELAKKNEKASKELKDSYVKRITTEKTALKEIERLGNIISMIRDEQRKVAFDELNKLRDKLYVLSIENERASSELEDSYNKKVISEEQVKKETRRLALVIKEVEEHKRKVAFDELTIVRDKLYNISLKDKDAKLHLQESYNKRITTERAIIEEVERLSEIVDNITEERRRLALEKLLDARGNLHGKTRESDTINRALNDSYNKRIVDEGIAYKEIERLVEIEEEDEFRRKVMLK